MQTKIRKAKYEDASSMDKVNRMILPENYELDIWQMLLSSSDTISYVLEDKNTIVGYVIVALDYDNLTRVIGHVYSLGMLSEYRRKGYGKQLLEKAEDDLIKKGINKVILCVRKTNKSAIKFYSKLKYNGIKEVKEYYGKKQDAFLMKKILFKK